MDYTIETVMAKLDENIPSLSPTTAKVMQLVNNINTPPAELTKVIKLDPILSAKVLKLVNSSYFALPNTIVSLEKAIIMLGMNTIKNLALSAAVLTQMESNSQKSSIDKDGFWKHSLGVGVAAKLLAQKKNVEKKVIEDYFIAGLLHDLGILVEDQIFPEAMERILVSIENLGLYDAEEIIMDGLTHCTIGKALAEKWNLADELAGVIQYHHKPFEQDGSASMITHCVYCANVICKKNGIGLVLDPQPEGVDPAVYQTLGIDSSVEQEICAVLESEINKAMEFLKV